MLPEEVRRKNLYRTGYLKEFDHTHHRAGPAVSAISARSGTSFTNRRTSKSGSGEIQEFNRANRWRKRGIAMIPQKYGIAFTEPRGR